MSFLHRIVARAAKGLAENPEARAKASEVFEEDIKPRAKQAWKEAQPEIANAKLGLKRWVNQVREEYRKGRDGE